MYESHADRDQQRSGNRRRHCDGFRSRPASDIPKGKIQECMEAIHTATAQAPVHLGDVILTNIADTGVNLIATKAVGRR